VRCFNNASAVTPSSSPQAYNATEASFWSLQESALSPACVVQPKTARDVARVVDTVGSSGSETCVLAIKAQGHAPAAGCANIQDGATLDMSHLNTVATTSIAAAETVAHVEAGVSWLSVYRALDSLGLAVSGGRNGLVGVAGLVLGAASPTFCPGDGGCVTTSSTLRLPQRMALSSAPTQRRTLTSSA
jgi:FAD/FMN-containing dehydrogenase